MKQQLGSLFKLVTGFIVVLTLGACLLPAKISSTYSVTLQSRAEDIFPVISDLRQWSAWMESPFSDIHTSRHQAVWSIPTKDPGVSLIWSFNYTDQKQGLVRILEAKEPEKVSYVLENDTRELIQGQIVLHEEDSGTTLTRTTASYISNPWGRYMSFFIKGWMLREIKENIRHLNKYLLKEGKVNGVVSNVFFSPKKDQTVWALYRLDTVSSQQKGLLHESISNSKILSSESKRYSLEPIYHPYYSPAGRLEDGRYIFHIGFPVKDTIGYQGQFPVISYNSPTISIQYIGAAAHLYMAVDALEAYARINKLLLHGPPIFTLIDTPIETGVNAGMLPVMVSIQVLE